MITFHGTHVHNQTYDMNISHIKGTRGDRSLILCYCTTVPVGQPLLVFLTYGLGGLQPTAGALTGVKVQSFQIL